MCAGTPTRALLKDTFPTFPHPERALGGFTPQFITLSQHLEPRFPEGKKESSLHCSHTFRIVLQWLVKQLCFIQGTETETDQLSGIKKQNKKKQNEKLLDKSSHKQPIRLIWWEATNICFKHTRRQQDTSGNTLWD